MAKYQPIIDIIAMTNFTKKHRSHIKGKRGKGRPFGKYAKFNKYDLEDWLRKTKIDDSLGGLYKVKIV
jgi:hypothetical protein